MTNEEMIAKLGEVIGCLQNIEANEADDISNHYDCVADLIAVQRQLKAGK